jgi:type II secretory pathway pseudopilin PulG
MRRIIRAVTLLELVVSIVLLSVIVLGLATIDTFSGFQVINAEKRAKLQYEASIALEHMTKEINKAIGSEIINGPNTVIDRNTPIGGNFAVHAYIDVARSGQWEAPGGTDYFIAYRYRGGAGNPSDRYQIWYCPQCQNKPCNNCNPAWGDPENRVAWSISAFNVIKPVNGSNQLDGNFVTVQLTACWDPTQASAPCGTTMNPSVDMNTVIKMPSVTTN